MLVKSREMTGRSQTPPSWGGGGRGRKDDRNQNALAPFNQVIIIRVKLLNIYNSLLYSHLDLVITYSYAGISMNERRRKL
jgi:hypothetical protein